MPIKIISLPSNNPITTREELDEFVAKLTDAIPVNARILTYPGERLALDLRIERNSVVVGLYTKIPEESFPEGKFWNRISLEPEPAGGWRPPTKRPVLDGLVGGYRQQLHDSGRFNQAHFLMPHVPFKPGDKKLVHSAFAIVVLTLRTGAADLQRVREMMEATMARLPPKWRFDVAENLSTL